MNNNNFLNETRNAYRKMLNEDGMGPPNPPTSSAANAPEGAMSSEPYMAQLDDNPKLAVYNHQTKKKKVFTRQEDLDEFLKENPDWSKEPLEEAKEYYRADKGAAKTFLYKHRNTLDSIFGGVARENADFNKLGFDKFVKELNEFYDKHVTSHK